jgi:DNA-directed RNA polymerase specialized sigma24 family protein
MHAELPREGKADRRLVLWVSPIDEHHTPVHPDFLKAAGDIGLDFFLYRAAELNDDSRAMELAEKAVHRASRARKSRPVEDPVAYLFRTFSHLVDAELERSRRLQPLSDEMLNAVGRRESGKPAAELDRLILWREVLESVDETTRWVLWRLRNGFSVNEIANDLGIPPNTLSKRLSRVRQDLKKKLDRRVPPGPTSKIDGTRTKPGPDPRRNLPDDGRGDPKQLPESKPRRLPE